MTKYFSKLNQVIDYMRRTKPLETLDSRNLSKAFLSLSSAHNNVAILCVLRAIFVLSPAQKAADHIHQDFMNVF